LSGLVWHHFGVSLGGRVLLGAVNLSVDPGETLALVGESGSGKTLLCMAVLGMLPTGSVASGSVTQPARGPGVSMVFQEPMTSLDPTMRCGRQIEEVILRHLGGLRAAARARVLTLFEEVQLDTGAGELERVARSFPHELSGGQKQRVLIAMALSCNPAVLLADEPTTALDSTVRHEIMALLRRISASRGLATVLVSHDLGVVQEAADKVAVMRAGEVVEFGAMEDILQRPSHAYTRALLASQVPKAGRPFPLATVVDGGGRDEALYELAAPADDAEVIMRLENVMLTYPGADGPTLNGVSLTLKRGESLGLVGESGCGKSTVARVLMGLRSADAGSVDRGAFEGHVGLVFQDPFASLNPRMAVGRAIAEVMLVRGVPAVEATARAGQLLEEVGLQAEDGTRMPGAFSGGQRQRIVIARALAADPHLLICDEAVAALDVSVQAQVLNLLNELKARRGLSLLFISHDLSVVRYMCDRIAVMNQGRIVEVGEAQEVCANPQQDITIRLIEAGGVGVA
jgi:peptide/nickel transport system ATP-binding protein